jgi:hypothetical protein
MPELEPHYTAASRPEGVAPSIARESAMAALKDGPRGALVIASAVGLLFAGWLLFYLVLFMSRGYVG